MERFTVISGCSGGGKSTLLAELARRGHGVVEEPGRRVVEDERAKGGTALPWLDLAAFAQRAFELGLADYEKALELTGRVFFDRGLIDAALALGHATGAPLPAFLRDRRRYGRLVFLTPPWPEIYRNDGDRRHGFDAAVAEYDRLAEAYPALGYEALLLPKTSVAERADFVLTALDEV